ncbi:hypothetical protein S40285_04025 [Stachybotrys chlorohalonatus IBT 40285]|uniref:Histidine decarboxylase n=1 Tax=Stachybotrys chlorohalonatus (strain IBT 40285) TaxID=1283841 RepID=A0A084R086_STAC4|nr:hypothetical protein S40285_04025 [Stachybotrys chlorohalonata IBT 40285]
MVHLTTWAQQLGGSLKASANGENSHMMNVRGKLPYDKVVHIHKLIASKQDPATYEGTFTYVYGINDDVIQKRFNESKCQWIDDPVISQWRRPDHHIHHVLSEANSLYHEWKSIQYPSFSPSPPTLWLDTGRALADVGLPWHNNQVNLPDEIDTSWPFHFKKFETEVLQMMGARVGDPTPSGYVSSYIETNCYCVRALQQQLRATHPTEKPILLYDNFDLESIACFETFFGLEVHRVNLSGSLVNLKKDVIRATSNGTRPIIFVATICNSIKDYDDLYAIVEISRQFSLLLHLDAFRSFDYITTMSDCERHQSNLWRFKLGVNLPNQPIQDDDGCILASTIVAGGLHQPQHAPAAALKPASLGQKGTKVAYIRSFDSTLGGSRDAIGPLWLALYEIRLRESGLRNICYALLDVRSRVMAALHSQGISASAHPYCLDVIVDSCTDSQRQSLIDLGGIVTPQGHIALAIHLSQALNDESYIAHTTSVFLRHNTGTGCSSHKSLLELYPIPHDILDELRTTIQSWKAMARSNAGYPLHIGSLSALGPVIGCFWDLTIPQNWIKKMTQNLMVFRLERFGIYRPELQEAFKGGFTNGSTMGNRCGVHTALRQFPNAFLYFSAETHYSVGKILRDCDSLTNRWSDKEPRYSQIPCSSNGSILIDALIQQARNDQTYCAEHGETYHMILFANLGTTFVGARDDLATIWKSLYRIGIQPSYIHIDGAFDLGYNTCGIKLGPPGTIDNKGMPMVQGITISYHKALGQNVSGEVMCFSPENDIVGLSTDVDPRIVFETWLYSRIYSLNDRHLMLKYCRENATHLETGLKRIGMATKRNPGSTIVVMERPPAWIVEQFSLRPEGDWVHFIAMPHISKETINFFIDRVESVENGSSVVFGLLTPLISEAVQQPIKLTRIQCLSKLSGRVSKLVQANNISNLSQQGKLCTLVKSSLRGAISVAIMDEHNEIQVVFLAESSREQSISVGPLLVRSRLLPRANIIDDIAKHLWRLMSQYMKVEVKLHPMSYSVRTFL